MPMPDAQQTLEDTSVTSDGVTTTTLTFTKLIKEVGKVEILANSGDYISSCTRWTMAGQPICNSGHTVVHLAAGGTAFASGCPQCSCTISIAVAVVA
jgi:hypothetical protein